MSRPIHYMEIDLLIERGSAYYSASSWFISSKIDKPENLQQSIRSSQDEYEQLLYIAFKKRSEAILKSKATKEDVQITIKSHKQIGYTNR